MVHWKTITVGIRWDPLGVVRFATQRVAMMSRGDMACGGQKPTTKLGYKPNLVGGLVAIFGIFPWILGCCHHPNWRTPSFFRGVAQPPTSTNQLNDWEKIRSKISSTTFFTHPGDPDAARKTSQGLKQGDANGILDDHRRADSLTRPKPAWKCGESTHIYICICICIYIYTCLYTYPYLAIMEIWRSEIHDWWKWKRKQYDSTRLNNQSQRGVMKCPASTASAS